MTCKEIEKLLGALCDGSLESELVRAVESHIASCTRCRAEKVRIGRTIEALHTFERIEPSEDFTARLWQKVDEWEASRRALWVAAVATFLRRNRRVLVTCCVVFAVSLLSSVFLLRRMTIGPAMRTAEEVATEDFVIREIPEPAATGSDTVYLHFVTGDRPAQTNRAAEDYVFKPVVRPVSDTGPAF